MFFGWLLRLSGIENFKGDFPAGIAGLFYNYSVTFTLVSLCMKLKAFILSALFVLCLNAAAYAQSLKVAAAANLQSVIKILGADFSKRTGITIEPIVGSSGKLVAQISNGAPYDVFLSADMEFPQKLAQNGFAERPPVVYALGSLIICSTKNLDLKNWTKLITTTQIEKIAIANAAIAPYGRAAEESLRKFDLLDKVKTKIVYGESISQVNTYITTGVVTLGFTSLSLVKDPANTAKLNWQLVDTKSYAPIQQGMVLLKKAANKQRAEQFYRYLLSAPAKNILKKYGYILP